MTHQIDDQNSPELTWREGDVPVADRFDDPYFSLQNGLAETRHVFLAGNGLPARFRAGFHVAELGFGTGLNLWTTLLAWRQAGCPGPLHFTSFEAFPMSPRDMRRALAPFPEILPLAQPILDNWHPGQGVYEARDLRLTVKIGDARSTLPNWNGTVDAWFLDGFSPAKNRELWQPDLMAHVGRTTKPGGTMATYSAAGFIRKGLHDAGFDVTRVSGFGRKRHMTIGQKPSS